MRQTWDVSPWEVKEGDEIDLGTGESFVVDRIDQRPNTVDGSPMWDFHREPDHRLALTAGETDVLTLVDDPERER